MAAAQFNLRETGPPNSGLITVTIQVRRHPAGPPAVSAAGPCQPAVSPRLVTITSGRTGTGTAAIGMPALQVQDSLAFDSHHGGRRSQGPAGGGRPRPPRVCPRRAQAAGPAPGRDRAATASSSTRLSRPGHPPPDSLSSPRPLARRSPRPGRHDHDSESARRKARGRGTARQTRSPPAQATQ